MKNILAENMLRFGVKNLSESDLYRISQRTLLKEIVTPIQTMPTINIQTLLSNPDFASAAKVAQTWITQNKLLFNIPNANVWLAISALLTEPVKYPILQKVAKAMLSKGDAEQMIKLLMTGFVAKGMGTLSQYVMNILVTAKKDRIEIQLNEHPDYSGKVLTNGTIDATQFTAGDTNGVSSITDIVTFMNDHNLSNAITNPFGRNNIEIDPTTSFVKGKIGTDPGAGALDIEYASGLAINYQPTLYSTFKFDAATAKTTGTAITDITYTPGDDLESNLGKQLFKTGTITPEADMVQKVKEAVDAAKSLGTITAARIESGASFDRPINADNAAFAKIVNMTADNVPANPKLDKEGIVTDPMSGGNAFLAHYRGIAIKDALGTQAGVTPTIVAKVARGGDDAQYAKIFFTVKKADGSTTVTYDDVKTIGKKSASSDLSGQFKIMSFDIL